jgi:hypothetical protein
MKWGKGDPACAFLKKAAASTVAVGLLTFGAVAGGGGSALASTGESVTACSPVGEGWATGPP